MPSALRYDRLLCGTILTLTFFGLVMVFSATTASSETTWTYIIKQGIAASIGLTAMRYLMFLDYRKLRQEKVVFAVLGVSVVLLVLAALLGTGANTRRFLRLWHFSLQPSELAKPALILFLAFYLEQRRERLDDWRTVAGLGFIIAVLSLLIYVGRDFGTMASLLVLAGVMLFVAGLPLRFIAPAVAALAPLLFFFVLARAVPAPTLDRISRSGSRPAGQRFSDSTVGDRGRLGRLVRSGLDGRQAENALSAGSAYRLHLCLDRRRAGFNRGRLCRSGVRRVAMARSAGRNQGAEYFRMLPGAGA